jgi:hypothetical protein
MRIAEKSPQQNIEGNTTMSADITLKVAHKVSDHHRHHE